MLKKMKTYGHLNPGQKGTRRLMAQYGSSLICVRYRYDEEANENVKTVEIVVDRRPGNRALRHHDAEIVHLAVAYREKELQEKLKAVGGRWDPDQKVWQVHYGSIKTDPDLMGRILRD